MNIGDFYLTKTNKLNVIYHIPSGNICKVSDEIFDCLKRNDYDNQEVIKLLSALNELPVIKTGKNKPKSELLNNVLFISSENCNLRCKYCFVEHGRYNGKTDTKNMDLETYIDSIRYALHRYPKGIKSIGFFGGEPLLNFDTIKEFVLWYEESVLNKNKDLYRTKFGIVTNGTLANADVINFLIEHDIAVTLSIDGPKDVNDSARVMVNGESSYDIIFNNLDLWSNDKLTLGIEATINNYHIKNYRPGIVKDWIDNLRKLNFNDLAMFTVVTDNEDTKITDAITLGKIYNEVVDYWFDKILNEDDLKCVDTFVLGMTNNILLKRYVSSCSVYNSLTVDPCGKTFPCQMFCQSGSYCMGSIQDQTDTKRDKIIEELMLTDRNDVKDCKDCWVRNFCTTWCKGNSQNSGGNLTSTVRIQCLQTKLIAERIIYNLALLLSDPEKMARFTRNFNRLKDSLGEKQDASIY